MRVSQAVAFGYTIAMPTPQRLLLPLLIAAVFVVGRVARADDLSSIKADIARLTAELAALRPAGPDGNPGPPGDPGDQGPQGVTGNVLSPADLQALALRTTALEKRVELARLRVAQIKVLMNTFQHVTDKLSSDLDTLSGTP